MVRRTLKWGGVAALSALVLLLGVLFLLNRSETGQRYVLDYVLKQIEGSIDGTITVQGIRSRGLAGGATLIGISVRGSDGRPFLDIDSAQATYNARTFLSGDVVLASLVVYGARLSISRYPGEEGFNADRILRTDEAAAGGGPTRLVSFHDVRLVDAFVEILQPIDPGDPPPPRVLTAQLPGVEGRFQRIYFEDIQARISEAIITSPALAGPEVTVRSLSLVGYLYDDPFRLTQLDGKVSWAEGKLTVAADELSLPNTRSSGRIVADFTAEGRGGRDTGWVVDIQLASPRYSLADLQWLIPDLPDGEGEGTFQVRLTDQGDVRFAFSDATLAMGASRLAGQGTVLRGSGGGMSFQDVRVTAERLALERLEPFVGELPLEGTLDGRIALDGTLARLQAEGVVTLRAPGYEPTTADFGGTFHLGDSRGVTALVADLSPLDYRLLSVFLPASRLGGSGRAHIEATGTLAGGVRYRADLVHEPGAGLPTSEVVATGTLTKIGERVTVEVDADVSPLSLTALRSYFPELPASGEVTGSIRATGPIEDLRVTTDLETPAGRLAVEARFDARNPGALYQVEGELENFALSRLVPELPEPTIFTGYVQLEGRGTDLRTASIDALLRARDSRVAELDVDTATVSLRVREGIVYVDAADALVSGVTLAASGTLAAHAEAPSGEILVVFSTDQLERLRPVLMGRDLLLRDELTVAQIDSLQRLGIDPDTLPTAEDVALAGTVTGEARLSGSLQSFSATGSMTLDQVRYGTSFVRSGEVTFSAAGLPDFGETLRAGIVADSVQISGRSFRHAEAVVDYASPVGNAEILLERSDSEDYRARGSFVIDSLGGRIQVETLALRMDTLTWELEQVGLLSWDEEAIRVANLVLVQAGGGGVRASMTGILPRQGDADFTLQVQDLRLEQVVHLLQVDLDLGGEVDLDLQVRGSAERPLVTGTLDAADVRYQGYSLDRVDGSLNLQGRRLAVELEAWEGGMRVLQTTGTIPAVLNLRNPAVRFPDEALDLRVVADSLPAVFATTIFRDLTEVEGTVAGTFLIGGTLDSPAPSGSLELQNAAWTVEAIGVRHRNVSGNLLLRPDGTVEVDATARADGTAHLTGSVRLQPLTNPTFNLQVSFDDFRAVERREAVGNVSGIVRLTGTFRQPFIEGLGPAEGLRVESGELFLEEFVRAATVVDLSDPRFADLDLNLDIFETRIVAESSNPFMQNLRVNVDLAVEQDAWLRSSEMNVEIVGDLRVTYSRAEASIVLTGVLEARRGFYDVLGRRFQVQQGTVDFPGIPGIDPNLSIVATARVRRQSGDHLDIIARVGGTLTQPRVDLASEERAVSQSDLVSYLVFGRPSYELGAGERDVLRGAAGSFVGAGLGAVGGTFATRLGSVLAQQWGLDYFAISEVGSAGWDFGSVTQTQVELGQYLSHDLFLVLAFQPAQVVGPSPFLSFGTRIEYTPSDRYTVEAFWEDRFLRSRTIGFQDAAFRSQKILGLFVFTEWGY